MIVSKSIDFIDLYTSGFGRQMRTIQFAGNCRMRPNMSSLVMLYQIAFCNVNKAVGSGATAAVVVAEATTIGGDRHYDPRFLHGSHTGRGLLDEEKVFIIA